jgi:hypothetical protein
MQPRVSFNRFGGRAGIGFNTEEWKGFQLSVVAGIRGMLERRPVSELTRDNAEPTAVASIEVSKNLPKFLGRYLVAFGSVGTGDTFATKRDRVLPRGGNDFVAAAGLRNRLSLYTQTADVNIPKLGSWRVGPQDTDADISVDATGRHGSLTGKVSSEFAEHRLFGVFGAALQWRAFGFGGGETQWTLGWRPGAAIVDSLKGVFGKKSEKPSD